LTIKCCEETGEKIYGERTFDIIVDFNEKGVPYKAWFTILLTSKCFNEACNINDTRIGIESFSNFSFF